MSASVAHKPREDFGLPGITYGIIACVEGLRDDLISPYSAQAAAGLLKGQLEEMPPPRANLWPSAHLLACVTHHWAGTIIEKDDIARVWRRIALHSLDLVQTTMAREAGRMP